MNKIFATWLLLVAPAALAASTVDLTVKGLIIPAACTPSLSSNTVDHGKLSASDLNPDASQPTHLPRVSLQLRIDCDAATTFALRGTDNRSDSLPVGHTKGYGLGLINTDQRLGSYNLRFNNAVGDGAPADVLMSSDNGNSWNEYNDMTIRPGEYAGFGDWDAGSYAPRTIQNLRAELNVLTVIAPTSGLDLSNEVAINGSATLEVKYL